MPRDSWVLSRANFQPGDEPFGRCSTGLRCLHVDCSAAGIPSHPSTPVFDGDRITLQWVRTCQPTFSAAFIGFVESTFTDEETKRKSTGGARRFQST